VAGNSAVLIDIHARADFRTTVRCCIYPLETDIKVTDAQLFVHCVQSQCEGTLVQIEKVSLVGRGLSLCLR